MFATLTTIALILGAVAVLVLLLDLLERRRRRSERRVALRIIRYLDMSRNQPW